MDIQDYDFETLTVSAENDVLLVAMNRPKSANAMNTVMGQDLRDLFQEIRGNPTVFRCIVLTGTGERAFCAGADLKERNGMTDIEWGEQHTIFENAALAIMDCPVPLIGAVNGAAYGGGMELVLACDFAWGSDNARFALTETTLGIIPGLGSTQYLPRAVGTRRAKEIIFSGCPFQADDAFAWGLLNRVCKPSDLIHEVMIMAHEIASNAPLAVREAKKCLNHALQSDLKKDYQFELDCYRRTISTDDRMEGIVAFNEKRKAVFKGK